MSSAQVGTVLRHIRRLATNRKDEEVPDHQLLERFARNKDEAAFAALLERHGGMVLSVCRRILRDPHDVEDAWGCIHGSLPEIRWAINPPRR